MKMASSELVESALWTGYEEKWRRLGQYRPASFMTSEGALSRAIACGKDGSDD